MISTQITTTPNRKWAFVMLPQSALPSTSTSSSSLSWSLFSSSSSASASTCPCFFKNTRGPTTKALVGSVAASSWIQTQRHSQLHSRSMLRQIWKIRTHAVVVAPCMSSTQNNIKKAQRQQQQQQHTPSARQRNVAVNLSGNNNNHNNNIPSRNLDKEEISAPSSSVDALWGRQKLMFVPDQPTNVQSKDIYNKNETDPTTKTDPISIPSCPVENIPSSTMTCPIDSSISFPLVVTSPELHLTPLEQRLFHILNEVSLQQAAREQTAYHKRIQHELQRELEAQGYSFATAAEAVEAAAVVGGGTSKSSSAAAAVTAKTTVTTTTTTTTTTTAAPASASAILPKTKLRDTTSPSPPPTTPTDTTTTTTTTSATTTTITTPPSDADGLDWDMLLAKVKARVPPPMQRTTLRVAGGWVRDKLLSVEKLRRLHHGGRSSHHRHHHDPSNVDIDIALDNVLGTTFAKAIVEYLKQEGLQKDTQVEIISCTSDQAAHLETARVSIFGQGIDLITLRKESYECDSRIPTACISTPREDAMRRDLTINALYYNINQDTIEDFTGRGLHDLRNKWVRTPNHPLHTLLDDPLRVLRAIRFTSRLNFNMDPQLTEACKTKEVRESLPAKVSSERIYAEFDAMISSNHPIKALGLLCEFQLLPVIFSIPEHLKIHSKIPFQEKEIPFVSLGALINIESLFYHHFDGETAHSPQEKRIARYAAFFVPFAGIHCTDPKTKKITTLVHYILTHHLRTRNKDIAAIEKIHEASLKFKHLVRLSDQELAEQGGPRLVYAMLLRRLGQLWKVALQIALVTELSPAKAAHTYTQTLSVIPDVCTENESRGLIFKYKKLQRNIEELGLDQVWDLKPMVGGDVLTKSVLCHLPRGPQIGHILEKQLQWQILNPNKTEQQCIEWLKQTFPEYE